MNDLNFEDCSEVTNNKKIAVSENGRKFTINNPDQKEVAKIKVDGCLIDDDRERCDYLFEVIIPDIKDKETKNIDTAIYVELKGSDIEKAFKQIMATLGYLIDRHRQVNKECFIVASRVPKASTKTQELAEKLKKSHRLAKLLIRTTQHEHKI